LLVTSDTTMPTAGRKSFPPNCGMSLCTSSHSPQPKTRCKKRKKGGREDA
jgi:hypothetical protein